MVSRRRKMHELYGESIPALISQHYQREKLLIQDLGMEKQLAFFRQFAARCHELKASFVLRGRFGTSLVCWLLGITEINPLPAHYYCLHLQTDSVCK